MSTDSDQPSDSASGSLQWHRDMAGISVLVLFKRVTGSPTANAPDDRPGGVGGSGDRRLGEPERRPPRAPATVTGGHRRHVRLLVVFGNGSASSTLAGIMHAPVAPVIIHDPFLLLPRLLGNLPRLTIP